MAGPGPSRILAAIAAGTADPGQPAVVPDEDHAIVRFLHPNRLVSFLPGIRPAIARALVRYGPGTVAGADLAAAPSPGTGLSPQSAHSQASQAEQRYCEPWVSEYRPAEPATAPPVRRIAHRGQRSGCVGGDGV